MTPQDKAKQLVDMYRIMIKFNSIYNLECNDVIPIEERKMNNKISTMDAKMYAIAAAGEVIEQEQYWINATGKGNSRFWEEVKKEIEKL